MLTMFGTNDSVCEAPGRRLAWRQTWRGTKQEKSYMTADHVFFFIFFHALRSIRYREYQHNRLAITGRVASSEPIMAVWSSVDSSYTCLMKMQFNAWLRARERDASEQRGGDGTGGRKTISGNYEFTHVGAKYKIGGLGNKAQVSTMV